MPFERFGIEKRFVFHGNLKVLEHAGKYVWRPRNVQRVTFVISKTVSKALSGFLCETALSHHLLKVNVIQAAMIIVVWLVNLTPSSQRVVRVMLLT